ncbi:hypothetical protein GY45DRAFT_1225507, partial [Cubamyces sp. BRFM 1775]
IENYCIIASSALLWFDIALTVTTERERIWKRKITWANIVYLGMRYVGAIERIFFVLEVLVWNFSDRVRSLCAGITHTDDTLTFLNYLAFSGKDMDIITPIATEAILTILTWVKTFGIIRDARRAGISSPLATLLLRDGEPAQCRSVMFTLVAQLSPLVVRPSVIWLVWPYFSQVLTIITASRLILNLRGLYFATGAGCEGGSASLAESNLRFLRLDTANIIGNLGATLILPTH